eukprot:TRINITY_DN2239_c0_g1_i1.p3 TRINITY_DN2239_c0_g1~~TRINITY_DN2239_c0_g1_i1.p3  ORF type:complete len:244 (+),score=29.75 TRINITY_DN2239_c0_g1_i1:1061-1792(+)
MAKVNILRYKINRENVAAREKVSLIEAKYKDSCARLIKESQELKTENEQLRTNLEIMRADTKENVGVFSHNSEKETMAWHYKGLKDEIKQKDKEIAGLKTHVIEYEREIAKLREKLRYLKEANMSKSICDVEGNGEISWKDTCLVWLLYGLQCVQKLSAAVKERDQEIHRLKDRQTHIMSLVRENNKQFNDLITVLTEVLLYPCNYRKNKEVNDVLHKNGISFGSGNYQTYNDLYIHWSVIHK